VISRELINSQSLIVSVIRRFVTVSFVSKQKSFLFVSTRTQNSPLLSSLGDEKDANLRGFALNVLFTVFLLSIIMLCTVHCARCLCIFLALYVDI